MCMKIEDFFFLLGEKSRGDLEDFVWWSETSQAGGSEGGTYVNS